VNFDGVAGLLFNEGYEQVLYLLLPFAFLVLCDSMLHMTEIPKVLGTYVPLQ
jgi:hypothetical protein